MSKQTIKDKSLKIRNETRQHANTRGRVADVIDELNDYKADLVNGKVPLSQLPEIPDTGIQSIQQGANITIDNTDPLNPVISAIGGEEKDTLDDVIKRGNYASNFITFINDPVYERAGAIGMKGDTYSMYFGNMNPAHTGYHNVSFGYGNLSKLTTGNYNTAIGQGSLENLTTGNVNATFGNSVMALATSAYKNTAGGQSALRNITTGSYNVAIGQVAGGFITNGVGNILLGAQTGVRVNGDNNVFIGRGAGKVSNTLSGTVVYNHRLVIHGNTSFTPNPSITNENIVDESATIDNGLIIGDFAERWVKFNGRFTINPSYLISDDTFTKQIVAKPDGTFGWEDKVAISTPSLEAVVQVGNGITKNIVFEPSEDIAGQIGFNKNTYSYYFGNMNPDHTGVYNMSFGYGALEKVTTGTSNIALGPYALNNLTTGTLNTALGSYALNNVTSGTKNTALGSYALNTLTTGLFNTATGLYALSKLTTGTLNVAIGASAMENTVTGYKNIAIGSGVSYRNVNGQLNTVIGYKANNQAITGSKNIHIGAYSGEQIEGDNNIIIGVAAGRLDKNISNKLIIHSNHTLANYGNGTEQEGFVSTPQFSSLSSALITGDFAELWVKLNGKFIINPSYLESDNTFTKQIVAKADGTFGWEDRVSVPKPPTTGNFVLKSAGGVISWVAEV